MLKDYPSVAVVILNYNGKKFLEKFLPSVLGTNYPNLNIVIADNASTDDSVIFVKTNYATQINVIELKNNIGFAGGYNEALQYVEAEYFVLLNSDVEVTDNWVMPIIELMEQNPQIGACQPKIRYYEDKKMLEYAGAAGGFIDRWGYPFARGRIFDTLEEDCGQYNDIVPIFWATGAALFIKKNAWVDVKGFDSYFFAHQEEVDLCWRLQLLGWKVYSCPQSVVYHVGGGTLPKSNPRKLYLNIRNSLIMLSKNLDKKEKFGKLLSRLVLDGVFGAKLFLTGKWREVWAIIQAHFGYYRWYFTVKKEHNLTAVPLRMLDGVVNQSIVWAYYARGKKYFSEIIRKK
ncbi:glycosyltransferase family 2 protein [Rhizosphaericola mali]|uniref:Glycosyltransferase family 2 protein n=1 Tax=Rhizosphaericola mali TaxID=2545455 RepID=A0A5P2FUR8_9BACT|nr:glycosyltransferase family 2 protein [Rhizosphaericola mali]QES87204.1 glycosyltransferase family 2 protein [Rhizosphaericola mali]